MSNDLQKYENWRAITESDYVTMFIKTWFAFVATLRKLYPHIGVFAEDGKPRGDRPFTNEFKNRELKIISDKINTVEFSNILLKIYKISREKTANIFPQYFFTTFYRINEDFQYQEDSIEYTVDDETRDKKVKDRTYIELKVTNRFKLSLRIQINGIYNRKNYNENIKLKIEFKDIIEKIDLSNIAFIDEFGYLKKFYEDLYDRIQNQVYTWIKENLQKKYTESLNQFVISKLNFCLTKVKAQIDLNFNSIYQNRSVPEDSYLILKQRPLSLFYFELQRDIKEDKEKKYVYQKLKEDIFLWFIDFVISLRNALFHEIIDPLDEEWQLIYKNAYIALKEVLDSTTSYLLHKEIHGHIVKTYIDAEDENLYKEIKLVAETEAFELHDYELIDDNIEITLIEVQDVNLIDNSICLMDKQSAKFRCEVNLSLEGRARVFDYNQSMYDKEDEKYYYIVHDEVKFKNAEAKIEIETEIEYDLRDIANTANIVDVIIKDRMIIVKLSNDERDTYWESIFPDEDGII